MANDDFWLTWQENALQEEKEKYLTTGETLDRLVGDKAGGDQRAIARGLQKQIDNIKGGGKWMNPISKKKKK